MLKPMAFKQAQYGLNKENIILNSPNIKWPFMEEV
jgi:hypothetical protein